MSQYLGRHSRINLGKPTKRGVIVLLLMLTMASLLVLDQRVARPGVANVLNAGGAAPASALSSAWYCTLVPATRADPGAGSVVAFNPGGKPVSGTITIYPMKDPAAAPQLPAQQSMDVPVTVPARGRTLVSPGTYVDSPFAAMLVNFSGGGVGVEHSVRTAQGTSYAPCATNASDSWYFADGDTQAGSTLQIGLFNPFLEDAIADVNFVTSDGTATPEQFQGLSIPAHQLIVINVSDSVRRRDYIMGAVTVRAGRVITDELQTGAINGVPGVALVLPAAHAADLWFLPEGSAANGLVDRLVLFNPTDVESQVDVTLMPDKGSSVLFSYHVPAQGRVAVELENEPRVPKDVRYALKVVVRNGVPVVAQRTATSGAPAPMTGATTQTASSVAATRWVVPAGDTTDPSDEWVYVSNPGDVAASVVISTSGDGNIAAQPPAKVDPKRRLLVHVDDLAPTGGTSVVVESDQPVVVGREIETLPGTTFTATLGLPVR